MLRTVIFLVCAVCILAEGELKIPPPDPTIPLGPTTSPSPNSTTSTTPSTTTTTKPTTTTTKPTTTTTKSTTTTTPTTTTTKTTTTTPTTTTTKTTTTKTTPAPSPPPTPVGPPVINSFTGNYSGSNRVCLMMKVQVQVELLDKDSTKLNITDKVTFNAICAAGNVETLTLYWGSNNLTFGFFKNNSKYEIESISATILSPDTNKIESYYHKKAEFSVPDKQSYKCVKDQALNLTDINSTTTYAKLHVSQLQYQAFMNTTEAHYDSAWYCDATNTSDVVPVVVGCVLAVLVVLVLVAYLFGRRRCQARGYLSM